MRTESGLRLGIDIGGTFTDFSLVDAAGEVRASLKVATVPAAPEEGVRAGLRVLKEEYGLNPAQVGYFVHGMTIGLNTLLQRRGSAVALLVTEGFRDVLTLQRLRLPVPYDFASRLPEPLVERWHTYGVPGRLGPDGAEVVPLDLAAVDAAADDAAARGAEGVAVCFLHSYANPAHEHAAAERVRAHHPELAVACSCDLLPQAREYERCALTVTNLYVRRNVESYFANLRAVLAEEGFAVTPFITQSNGGVMDVDTAAAVPVRTLFSGPAAGVIGAAAAARAAGLGELMTLDMGGTSTDMSIVAGGEPTYTTSSEIGGYPVPLPSVDIVTVGAGGGSTVWLDHGLLRVGPSSVGSDPGPACYGRGDVPALTDAFVVCGLVGAERFGGGRLALDAARSEAALGALAGQLGSDAATVADEAVRVAVATMYAEIDNAMGERGFDPRDLTLVAYGGGGPVVANLVAREIGARAVFVPRRPGTLCALGALGAPFTYEEVADAAVPLASADPEGLRAALASLDGRVRAWLASQRTSLLDGVEPQVSFTADVRYVGQSHEVPVALAGPDEPVDLDVLATSFHAEHERLYGHCEPGAAVELVALRARISAHAGGADRVPEPAAEPVRAGGPAPRSRRPVRLDGAWFDAAVYAREDLRAGDMLCGPAVVEQDDTTVVVVDGWVAQVDGLLNMTLLRREAHGEGGAR